MGGWCGTVNETLKALITPSAAKVHHPHPTHHDKKRYNTIYFSNYELHELGVANFYGLGIRFLVPREDAKTLGFYFCIRALNCPRIKRIKRRHSRSGTPREDAKVLNIAPALSLRG